MIYLDNCPYCNEEAEYTLLEGMDCSTEQDITYTESYSIYCFFCGFAKSWDSEESYNKWLDDKNQNISKKRKINDQESLEDNE